MGLGGTQDSLWSPHASRLLPGLLSYKLTPHQQLVAQLLPVLFLLALLSPLKGTCGDFGALAYST